MTSACRNLDLNLSVRAISNSVNSTTTATIGQTADIQVLTISLSQTPVCIPKTPKVKEQKAADVTDVAPDVEDIGTEFQSMASESNQQSDVTTPDTQTVSFNTNDS